MSVERSVTYRNKKWPIDGSYGLKQGVRLFKTVRLIWRIRYFISGAESDEHIAPAFL